MIAPNPPASGADGAVAAYEELRSYILAGSPSSRHFGLVLLLREGIAAWIERCAARSAPAARSAALDHAVSAPLASQQLHDDMVRVLASIALTGREEMEL